ncbi:class D sortase [Paenibacillus sp. GCM10012307]|uniref:Class D sortase n=2 Tax=Paenibacillus roseus TaxID=2798579 RepID=A0A934J6Q0_9BACL|nr:class D sortase [Paenibacillus roseus]
MGAILLMAGIAIVLYPYFKGHQELDQQAELVASFEQLGNTERLEELSSSLQPGDDPDVLEKLQGARGVLRIPRIDLEIVIFEGSSLETLSAGIGMIEPGKEIGAHNVGLAGHRALTYGKQFNRVGELESGDVIEVKTQEKQLTFIVKDSFVVPKTRVDVLNDNGEPMLTLVTCTPAGKKNPPDRLIITAELQLESP